jgi:hypothetical protein
MKRFALLVIASLLIFSGSAFALDEWLVCDPPIPAENVIEYSIIVDGLESIIPIDVHPDSESIDRSWLLNVTAINSANIEIRAINDQGRQGDLVPFVLKAKPQPLQNVQLLRQ